MTPANWISNGEPVASVPLTIAEPPFREWRIGQYEIRRSRRQGRWTVQTASGTGAMCGAAGYRTPVAAFLATWRMLRRG